MVKQNRKYSKKTIKKNVKRAGDAMPTAVNTAVDSAATFGRVMSYWNLIIGTLIFGGFLALGIYLSTRKNKYTGNVDGNIETANCTITKTQNGYNRSCVINIKYTLNGKDYNIETTASGNYNKNQKIKIYYDPTNPNDATISSVSVRKIGIIMAIISGILLLLIWLWFWFVQKHKEVAAVSGVANATGMVSTAISGPVGTGTVIETTNFAPGEYVQNQ